MISRPVVVSPVKATLATRALDASGLPASTPNPLTMFTTPGGNRSAIRLIQKWIDAGVCSAGLMTTALPHGERGRQLPGRHEDREVPGDDLGHHSERLMEVIRHRVVVDLAQRTFLSADRSREIAEVVDRQRDVRRQRLTHRLAVLPALRDRQSLKIGFHPLGDPQQDVRPIGGRGVPPGRGGRVRRVECLLHVLSCSPRDLREDLAVDGTRVLEILPPGRGDVLSADEVVVSAQVCDDGTFTAGRCVSRHADLPLPAS